MPGRWRLLLCGLGGLRWLLCLRWFGCRWLLLRKIWLPLHMRWLLGWRWLLTEQYASACPRSLQAVLVSCHPKPKNVGFPSLVRMVSTRVV